MQCEFQMNGGGYSIDKIDARLKSYYVPIGLHHHGEDSYSEDPVDDFYLEYYDKPVLDQTHVDKMLYIVTISKPNMKDNKKTRKQKRKS
jgi:hypothetical protein